MANYFIRIEESRDDALHVVVSRDKKGHFLGVASEESRAEALAEAKALALEALLDLADQGEFPLQDLYHVAPRQGGILLNLQDLFPILLRYKRCQHGLTQTALAERMDVRQQVYARLERPGKSNPTLATIERLSFILDEDILALA